ncbi:hypothetical protein PMEGAPL103_31890 [Priestia megaterium]
MSPDPYPNRSNQDNLGIELGLPLLSASNICDCSAFNIGNTSRMRFQKYVKKASRIINIYLKEKTDAV